MINSLAPQASSYCIRKRIRDAITRFISWIYAFLKLPGFVRSIDYSDRVTGDYIRIHVGRRFTILTVNNRQYWFRRFTGRFDGTGYVVCSPTTQEQLDCILADTHVSAHSLSLWGRLKLKFQSIGWGCFW